MNPMNNYTPIISPMLTLVGAKDNEYGAQRIPQQLRDTLDQPTPRGWKRFYDPDWQPDDIGIFSTTLPHSVDDACTYAREIQYPFPKTLMYMQGCSKIVTLYSIGIATVTSLIALGVGGAELRNDNIGLVANRFSYSDIIITVAMTFAVLYMLGGTCYMVAKLLLNRTVSHATPQFTDEEERRHRPTPRMVKIKQQGVEDVFDLSPAAFDVFCYDTEHYNEFIELYITLAQSYAQACDTTGDKAEETREACRKILTDWLYKSAFRQDVTKKARGEAAKQHKQLQADAAHNNPERDIIAHDFDKAYATALLEVFDQQQQQQRQ